MMDQPQHCTYSQTYKVMLSLGQFWPPNLGTLELAWALWGVTIKMMSMPVTMRTARAVLTPLGCFMDCPPKSKKIHPVKRHNAKYQN